MATKDEPDSTAASPAEAKSIENLLMKYNREETASFRRRLTTACCHRSQTLNQQTSPLLKLPTELILEIGKLVLGVRGNELQRNRFSYCHRELGGPDWGKNWFAQTLPLLQTCNQLRSQLRPLRFESVPLRLLPYRFGGHFTKLWQFCVQELAKWPEEGPHKGMKILHVNYPFESMLSLSTAAALAGGLECMIYGHLMDPPVVYWNCLALDPTWDDEAIEEEMNGGSLEYLNEFEVNHSREKNMWATYDPGHWRLIGVDEAAATWAKTKSSFWA